jgi:hypothetical protein
LSLDLFETIPAGVTTRSNPHVQFFDVAAATAILQGSVINNDGSGFINSVTAEDDAKYVAIEPIDNTLGAQGDIRVGCVGAGEFVTVVAGATIVQGSYVKILTAGTNLLITTVTPWVAGDDESLILGRYFAKPSGNVTRATSDPFNETYTDEGDFNVNDAVTTEIIEIRVGSS